jgi:hypothetical protein
MEGIRAERDVVRKWKGPVLITQTGVLGAPGESYCSVVVEHPSVERGATESEIFLLSGADEDNTLVSQTSAFPNHAIKDGGVGRLGDID